VNTKHICTIIIALLVALASLACVASPTSTPAATSTPAHTSTPAVAPTSPPPGFYDGVWAAVAATGDSIVITVENDVVTKVKVGVTVYGKGWQATSERVHPVASPLIGRTFFVEVRDADWITQIVGSFEGDVLYGSLNAAHAHPQGLGTAEAVGVNFTATRHTGGGL
jgi:hypothetical protein